MKTLEKTQWLSSNKLKELQRERLQRLIHHAYRTVPYYHRLFDERKLKPDGVKDVNDFAKLPVLTRNDVRNNLKDLISIDYPRKKMRRSNTGGSTGEPLVFYTTRENRQWSSAARFLAWRWAGFEAGDKYAQFFGSPIDIKAYTSVRARLEGLVKRQLSFNSYRWSEADMATFARVIAKAKPRVIYGNAVPVAMMAQFLEDQGFQDIRAKSVIIDSNQLSAREVETIKRVFRCDVWWNYHNRDVPRFTWWPGRGTTEWVTYRFDKPRKVGSCDVYWFDDGPERAYYRVPSSWKIYYRAGDAWREVRGASGYGTELDRYNRVTFEAIETNELKLEVTLREGFSGGILEWRVGT